MKHPNKKIEKRNHIKATCNLKSCFNFWLNKPNQYWPFRQRYLSTVGMFAEAFMDMAANEIVKKRQGGKTVIVKLEDL